MGEFTAVIAIIMSLVSLGMSLYNFYNDRARVNAWLEVQFHSFSPKQKGLPFVYLKILNQGRRPVIVSQWVLSIGEVELSSAIVDPWEISEGEVNLNELENPHSFFASAYSSNRTSKKLNEAEFFERFIVESGKVEEMLIETRDGDYVYPERMFIEDVKGGRYPVRNLKKVVNELNRWAREGGS
ncbi:MULTISPECIES: hypothetical protein [Halomonadaceae]|uniref:Uncharacterized protein n=1 Tax=Billgrantia aerodenitrificans TaxID=2733483 RepID=A0ABS9B054_9GAMM|nr:MULTISPECIES: hypothetical protein [Halomonas]MCE8027025.1 hypothetical protein [Halomonas aerodenitrificans]